MVTKGTEDDLERRFQVQSRPGTYQTGVTVEGRQVVMGMHVYPWVVAVFFTNEGTLSGFEKRSVGLTQHPDDWYDPMFQARLHYVLESWHNELGFVESPIAIKLFFVDELRIGIRDYPPDIEDYINNPNQYSEDDREEFLKDIADWKRDSNCVFWWNTNYLLNREGETL